MAQRQMVRPLLWTSSTASTCSRTQPASSSLIYHRTFSSTPSRPSQIGRTPLSIPPEVTFRIVETPKRTSAIRTRGLKPQPVVEIEGPLGKLSMDIPDYVRIDHDVAARKATVRILDKEVKQQMAMWGMYMPSLPQLLRQLPQCERTE